ncbi:MAG: rhodanese-like domain-containing protein [Maribacter sp.]|nr:rhodanese-like domain-containing protein [Maribacter sp.]
MKELEKTKRISISTVLFILVLIIGVLTFKQPKNVYKKTHGETLKTFTSTNYLVDLDAVDEQNSVLIDVRSKYDYARSHIKNAINLPTAEILDNESITAFKDLKSEGKIAVLYGKNPNEANSAWMILYQLGFDNIKNLNVAAHHSENNLLVIKYDLEKPIPKYMDIFKPIAPEKVAVIKKVTPKPPIKVVPKKKKKKRKPEGGC